ncbi:hypothetical protein EST38_g3377 [Candolleomyces aberdarensis]|uniref:SET domain-containing protein n=1 Tax=Candolleomyces aberdarensis TaxID=2316362 RepID=A0A4Q2DQK2_9AGAR|nr:hypothetical protein EST38_g3377 [Candolleomyces aberdarensis]
MDDPPFKVIDTPTKGFGMFAARPISKGSLIFVEHPIFIVPAMPLPKGPGFQVYEQVGSGIPEDQYQEMTTMANCRDFEECPSIVEGVARTNALNLEFRFPSIFDGSGGRHYGGAFLKINRCNHSCGPNAAYKWNLSLLSATLYALRDIQEGEEITITYADPLQPRSDRWKKLQPDYRFTCDCPWCTHSDSAAQEESDNSREYLQTYVATHPSYRKWSADPCLPDNHVIDAHLSALPVIQREGLDALLPLFMEEILRCYGELGNEAEFKAWTEKTIELCSVGDRKLAQELKRYLENPQKNFPRWAKRRPKPIREGLTYHFVKFGLATELTLFVLGKSARLRHTPSSLLESEADDFFSFGLLEVGA